MTTSSYFSTSSAPMVTIFLRIVTEADRFGEGRAVGRKALLRRQMSRRLEAFHVVRGHGRHCLVEPFGAVHRALHISLDVRKMVHIDWRESNHIQV